MSDEKILQRRPSGPGRLSAEQAADLPDRILDAALELFSQDGYGGTTMERIAKKAGASTKTIYARYDNKADILQAVVVRLQDRTIAAHAATRPPDPRNVDPHLFLSSFGVSVVMNLNEQATAGLNRLAFAESHRFPELRRLFDMVLARGANIIRHGLEAWSEQGLLPALRGEFDRAATLCMTMMLERCRIRAVIGDPMSQGETEAHMNYAVEMFLRACGYEARR